MFRRSTFVDILMTKGLVFLFYNQKPPITTSAKVTEVQRLLKLRTFDEGHQGLIWWVVWNLVGVLCMQSATIQGSLVHISSISGRAKQFISRGCRLNLCLRFDEIWFHTEETLDLITFNDFYAQVLGLGTKLGRIRPSRQNRTLSLAKSKYKFCRDNFCLVCCIRIDMVKVKLCQHCRRMATGVFEKLLLF